MKYQRNKIKHSFYATPLEREEILEEAKKLNMHFNEYLISCHKKALKENEAKEYFSNRNKGEWKMLFKEIKIKKTEEQIAFWENEIKELREQLEKGEITYDYFLETFKSFEEILEDKKLVLRQINSNNNLKE